MVATLAVPLKVSLAARHDPRDAYLTVTILVWASNVKDGMVGLREWEIDH
jgi:hypothetical protein